MARKRREKVDSGIYHIIIRGNNRQNIFYEDEDRLFFINRVHRYTKESGIELYSYCLMDNHVHFLIGKGNTGMALFVKKLACSYVYYFNHKYERTGHLFQGRYKSEPVETVEYFKTVYRYILHNPEKVKLGYYNEYKWSSFKIEDNCEVINHKFIIEVFGSDELRKQFLDLNSNDKCMEYISSYNSMKLHDDQLKIEFIKQLFSIDNVLLLNKDPRGIKKSRMILLKQCGLSVNQISRITGINRYFIRNA